MFAFIAAEKAGHSVTTLFEGHANAGGPGAALRPKRLHRHPGFDLGPQCHAAPGPGAIAGRRGLPPACSQAATRRWPTSLRIPGNHSLCGRRPRMRAQDDAHQSGLAAATRPLPLVNAEAVRTSRHRTRVSSTASVVGISAEAPALMGYAALWWAASTASPGSSIDASKEQCGSLAPPFVESWNTRRSPTPRVAGTTLSAIPSEPLLHPP